MKCVKINFRIKNARTFYRSLVGNKYFWFSVIKLLIYFAFYGGGGGGGYSAAGQGHAQVDLHRKLMGQSPRKWIADLGSLITFVWPKLSRRLQIDADRSDEYWHLNP